MSRLVASKYPSHAIIFDYLVSKRTGILTFEPGCRKLFFENGQLIFASSDQPDEHFANILVATGTLSAEQLETAKLESQGGTSLGRQLKNMGYATSQQLAHALKQQITMIVDRAISLQEGDCQSQETELPAKLPKLKIQTLGLIIKSILKMDSEIFSVPVPIDQPLYKTARGDVYLSKIATPASYLELFNFLGENIVFNPGTLQEIAQLDGDQLKKMIYVLHQLGILAFKDETSAIQEPLEDLTSNDENFQDDTFEEDALATVLPATTPPKTDPSAANDAQRAIRKINLPDFSQMNRPDFSPTLKVQDPRRLNQEVNETVREFKPILQNKDLDFEGDEAIPDFEKAISIDHDLHTISRELDPDALQEIQESENPLHLQDDDSLLSLHGKEDLDKSFDTEPGKEDFSSLSSLQNDDSETDPLQDNWQNVRFEAPSFENFEEEYEKPKQIPNSFPDFSDLISSQKNFQESVTLDPVATTDPSFDTEPALPVSNFLDLPVDRTTQQFPNSFTEINSGFEEKAPSIPSSVIMPDPNAIEESFYVGRKKSQPKRSPLKRLFFILFIAAGAFAAFYVYKNPFSSPELTLGDAEQTSQVSHNSTSPNEDHTPLSSSEEQPGDSNNGQEIEIEEAAPAPELNPLSSNEISAIDVTQTATMEVSDSESVLAQPLPPKANFSSLPFDEQIKESAQKFKNEAGTYSLVLIVACQRETVEEVFSKWPDQDFYLFRRLVNGADCWMITWGAYPSYASAATGREHLPAVLKQERENVWIVKPSI